MFVVVSNQCSIYLLVGLNIHIFMPSNANAYTYKITGGINMQGQIHSNKHS